MNDATEAAEVLTAGYVTDLEPLLDVPPYLPTLAETRRRYTHLNRQETRP